MTATTGYSGKTLAAKLGLKPGQRLLAIDAPAHYAGLVEPLPDGATLTLGRWGGLQGAAEVVHAFFFDYGALSARVSELVRLPSPRGMFWVSWPKKTSPLRRDLTENGVRALVLPTGWVDVKVAAIDADWSGLKFLMRNR